jgi:Domain of unknown function (DUF6048)
MSLKISSCTFSLVAVLALVASGQPVVKQDSTVGSFKPSGFRVGADVISVVKSYATDDFKGWELNADVDFRNYFLVAEVGHWQRNVVLGNGNYTNNGNYWRAGVDINLLKKDLVKNMFFFGFRVGHSSYDEQLSYTINSSGFGSVDKVLENVGQKSNWLELTTGLKVKIFRSFWLGYTGRIKLLPGINEDQQLQTYDIPGYGLTFKKPWWGMNYYMMFRIPFQKERK